MKHFAGLDVFLEEGSLCVVDGEGTIVAERKAASEPRAIAESLPRQGFRFEGRQGKPGALCGAGARTRRRCRRTILTPSCADHSIEHEKKPGPSGH